MAAQEIRHGLKPAGAVLDILLGYCQSLFAQAAQTAVCIRHHSIEQQLCWRLLPAGRATAPPPYAPEQRASTWTQWAGCPVNPH